jgi:curli biogenesis system outer membrane secretion channel CsgG
MKKTIAALIAAAILLAGCASSGTVQQGTGIPIDQAIGEAAAKIEEKLPGGTEVALVNVSSPSAVFSDYVLSGIETAFVDGGKLTVVDRSNLDKIRDEQGFQMSGEVSDESAKRIGQMLGASAIVTGSFTELGQSSRLALKAVTV